MARYVMGELNAVLDGVRAFQGNFFGYVVWFN